MNIQKAFKDLGISVSETIINDLVNNCNTIEAAIDSVLSFPPQSSSSSSDYTSTSSSDYRDVTQSSIKPCEKASFELPAALSMRTCSKPELARQLRDLNMFDERSIVEALKRCSSVESAMDWIYDNSSKSKTSDVSPVKSCSYECSICCDTYEVESGICTLDCNLSHKYCYGCISYHLKLALIGDEETSVHIPACPHNTTCHHVMTQLEIQQILRLLHQNSVVNDKEFQVMNTSIIKMYHAKVCRENNFVKCVGCEGSGKTNQSNKKLGFLSMIKRNPAGYGYGHDTSMDEVDFGNWFYFDNSVVNFFCVTCPNCSKSFCSQCKSLPYHYHCTCDEYLSFTRAWKEWRNSGRQQYLREVAHENSKYQEMLRQYEVNKQKNEAELRDIDARYQELLQDEQHKAKTCKLCPSCSRVIEKIDGCDVMICGRNYHGGDNQSGCGAKLAWSTAPPYVANTGQKRTINETNVPKPDEAQQVKHYIITNEIPMTCDGCRQDIVGPRINCLNCPSTNLCFDCSGNKRINNVPTHLESHICTVIWRNN